MKKKILFRADGNSSTGLGHLYRLFSLVETVKPHYEFVFITKEDSTFKVIPEDYDKAFIPNAVSIEEEPEWLSKHYPSDTFVLIADGYHFDSNYQSALKKQGYKFLYIDDLAKEHLHANAIINHSPSVKKQQFKTDQQTELYLGTNYALLRPYFLNEAKQNRVIKTIENVFVCFGGADPFNLTLKATQALLELQQFKQIHIVLGGAFKHQEIFELEKEYPNQVIIHENLSEKALIDVMKSCQFAIAPASTILYELCCVKMPILSGFYVDNQELIYKGFTDFKAVFEGGNFEYYTVNDFKKHVLSIIVLSNFESHINAQKQLFDHKIAERHLEIIDALC